MQFQKAFPLFLILLSAAFVVKSQTILRGTVYDYFNKRPLEGAEVSSSFGNHTITDSAGRFVIPVYKNDSVWFSFFSKNTMKYPVDTIKNFYNFEVALYVDVKWLPEVKVRNPDYYLDSLQNRKDYSKVFNFRKPSIRTTSAPSSYIPGSVTAGVDLDELINMFRFRRNRSILSMQQRLIQQEQDKYVEHRFTTFKVKQLTKLESPELDSFMAIYKPSYDLLTEMNEIELGYYIQQCFLIYKNGGRVTDSIYYKRPESN